MSQDLVLTNARLALPDRLMLGTLHVVNGVIADISGEACGLAAAADCDGDLLIPGLIDLHSDNLERQAQPRIAARWPSRSAYLAHDAQCAAAGITTVFDALCVGDLGHEQGRVRTYRDALADGPVLAGLVRAEHFLHLRCELPAPDMRELFDLAVGQAEVRMVSLIDHTPGFGQYADIEVSRRLRRAEGMAAAAVEALIAHQQGLRQRFRADNRAYVLARAAQSGVVLASHDDRTAAEVAQNRADGIGISEFPVTVDAARAARASGMRIIAGAPNLVRGGSHAGNVGVAALLAEGLVDALASDYVPSSLLEAVFCSGGDLADAAARVTAQPARMAGLDDRGRLAVGLRADLVRVHLPPGLPGVAVVRGVWRQGRRVA